jgi:hypothetical protein
MKFVDPRPFADPTSPRESWPMPWKHPHGAWPARSCSLDRVSFRRHCSHQHSQPTRAGRPQNNGLMAPRTVMVPNFGAGHHGREGEMDVCQGGDAAAW